jgi:hypothetical protein
MEIAGSPTPATAGKFEAAAAAGRLEPTRGATDFLIKLGKQPASSLLVRLQLICPFHL